MRAQADRHVGLPPVPDDLQFTLDAAQPSVLLPRVRQGDVQGVTERERRIDLGQEPKVGRQWRAKPCLDHGPVRCCRGAATIRHKPRNRRFQSGNRFDRFHEPVSGVLRADEIVHRDSVPETRPQPCGTTPKEAISKRAFDLGVLPCMP